MNVHEFSLSISESAGWRTRQTADHDILYQLTEMHRQHVHLQCVFMVMKQPQSGHFSVTESEHLICDLQHLFHRTVLPWIQFSSDGSRRGSEVSERSTQLILTKDDLTCSRCSWTRWPTTQPITSAQRNERNFVKPIINPPCEVVSFTFVCRPVNIISDVSEHGEHVTSHHYSSSSGTTPALLPVSDVEMTETPEVS